VFSNEKMTTDWPCTFRMLYVDRINNFPHHLPLAATLRVECSVSGFPSFVWLFSLARHGKARLGKTCQGTCEHRQIERINVVI
jgi:hypothetical protein